MPEGGEAAHAREAAQPSTTPKAGRPGSLKRWWVYQRERFPIFRHGLLIAAFSSSAVSYAALLAGRGGTPTPSLRGYGVAFVTCFLFFLQLRIADEFKDRDEDQRYRPYRPVPRGLIRLRELAVLFLLGTVLQFGLAIFLDPRLTWLLLAAWVYLALMSVEFFARDWLTVRPLTYLWTHMLMMPIVDFYAIACHWLPAGDGLPRGLKWFLAASFLNGVAIEFGRKIRQPADEEEGVPTYSRLWGASRAATAWLGVLAAAGGCGLLAAREIDFTLPLAIALGPVFLLAAVQTIRFRNQKTSSPPATGPDRSGLVPTGHFETISGIWTILFYLGLGLVPLAIARGWFTS